MLETLDTSQPGPVASTHVLGVRVDLLSQSQALARIQYMIERYHSVSSPIGTSVGNQRVPCQQIVTVNPEFVIAAQKNSHFRQCINEAALVVADGMGVVLATRYQGTPAPERITGTDLLPELARLCAEKGYRLYLLGAAPGVAELAGERLQKLAPALQIAGTYAGSPSPTEEDALIERIHAARADVLCVAYGAPAQELWIYRNLTRLPVAIAIGVGGAYDFLAGRQQRAPRTMQRLGIEWLYRLYREPSRWRRMLALPQFAVQVVLKGRRKYGSGHKEEQHS